MQPPTYPCNIMHAPTPRRNPSAPTYLRPGLTRAGAPLRARAHHSAFSFFIFLSFTRTYVLFGSDNAGTRCARYGVAVNNIRYALIRAPVVPFRAAPGGTLFFFYLLPGFALHEASSS